MTATIIAYCLGSTTLGAAIAGFFNWISKRRETRTQIVVAREDNAQEAQAAVISALQTELNRKSQSEQRQENEIAGLKVTNFLVLQHLLAVDRHFAEGNPPPPPPIPSELLAQMRGA